MRGKQKLNLTLIRHAQSKFNVAELEHAFDKVKFSTRFIDPEITELGMKQAQELSNQLKNKPYDIVFVSPLVRALQSATLIFKENPGKPKFIAIPTLSEWFSCSGELGRDYFKMKRAFKHVDFSTIDKLKRPEFWYLNFVRDEEWINSVLEEATLKKIIELETFAGFALEKLRTAPVFPETLENFSDRVQEAKRMVQQLIAQEGPEKSYAFVTHAVFLQEFTKHEEHPGIQFDNCQAEEFNLELKNLSISF